MVTMVVGGAGFIGLNIAERLLNEEKTVVLFDIRPVSAPVARYFNALPGRWTEVIGDVLDTVALCHSLRQAHVSHLFFGAAVTAGPQREAQTPRRIIETNLVGLASALEAARDAGLERVINLSSGAAYGETAHGASPLHEDALLEPIGLYPVTKATSERIVRRLAGLWSMNLVNVRLGPVFGPWELDSGVRDLLTPQLQATQLALASREAILMFDDHRDWTYSRDLARALVALMAHSALNHDMYNVSCGVSSSSSAWCEHLAAHFPGFSWRLARDDEEPNVYQHGPPVRQPLATDRLEAALGWIPQADFEAAFADWLEWLDIAPAYWEAVAAGP